MRNRAFVLDVVGPEDRLEQPQEEAEPDEHHADRQHAAAGGVQRDVAEARRRERRDGEIERVDVVRDLGVEGVLG